MLLLLDLNIRNLQNENQKIKKKYFVAITERAFDRAFHFEAESGPKSLTPGLNKVRSLSLSHCHTFTQTLSPKSLTLGLNKVTS